MASTAARPAEALANDVTSGRASLDGEPLALAWLSMSLGFPRGPAPFRTCRLLIESLPAGAPSRWRIRPRDGRRPASDALCRAPLEGAPDSLPPPPRQRTAISSNQSAFHRCRAPSALLSPGGEERRAPMSAISARMWKKLLPTRFFVRNCSTYKYASLFLPGLEPTATFFNTLYDSRARPGSPEPHSCASRGCPRDAPSG